MPFGMTQHAERWDEERGFLEVWVWELQAWEMEQLDAALHAEEVGEWAW